MKSKILYLLTICMMMVSCASHKKSVDMAEQKLLVATGSLSIKTSDKDVTLPASIHLERNNVARVQVFVPILGSEVGRVEFTPEKVLVMDRMNKQYMEEDYSTLQSLTGRNIGFSIIQDAIWNYLAKQEALTFTIPAGKKEETITIKGSFNDIKSNDDWEKRTTVSTKYKKVSIGQMSNILKQ